MLIVDHVRKTFGGKIAVDDVSFSIERGEIFALIGPNGSGKTTIIKTIAGLLHPNGGGVRVGGRDVVQEPLATKSIIGYIPDEPVVWTGMTGEEFLHFVGALFNIDEPTRRRRIPGLLSRFRLEGIEKDYFENYSRGNKQKFSILAAFLHHPQLLLIDEPIVGLDPESAAVAKNMLEDFATDGGAILLATHTLPVAEAISQRIGFLRQGRLISTGTLEELRLAAGKDRSATLEEIYTGLVRQ